MKGYNVTITFRVEGAETLDDAMHAIGMDADMSPMKRAPEVSVTSVTALRYNIRSLQEEHKS